MPYSQQDTTTSSDLSPTSEAGGRGAGQLESLGEEAGHLESLGEEAGHLDSDEASLDSLDEGLGDINCDNEVSRLIIRVFFYGYCIQYCFICRPLRFHCVEGCWGSNQCWGIRIHRNHMFLGLPDPNHQSEVWIRIRIILSTCKNSKKNLDF
jgi:hypothetical protein